MVLINIFLFLFLKMKCERLISIVTNVVERWNCMSKFLKREYERKGEKKNEKMESKLIHDNLSDFKKEIPDYPIEEDLEE